MPAYYAQNYASIICKAVVVVTVVMAIVLVIKGHQRSKYHKFLG